MIEIYVALIAMVGAVAAALITNWTVVFPPQPVVIPAKPSDSLPAVIAPPIKNGLAVVEAGTKITDQFNPSEARSMIKQPNKAEKNYSSIPRPPSIQSSTEFKYQNGVVLLEQGHYSSALAELKPLAESGDRRAQYQVGRIYRTGPTDIASFEQAFYWTKLSALQGLPVAQYNLGVMYQTGKGVAPNDDEAWKWYNLAAKGGFEPAIKLFH
jgi:hypothetical protein